MVIKKLLSKKAAFLVFFSIFGLLLINPEHKLAADTGWSGNFYNNTNLSETGISVQFPSLHLNWGYDKPMSGVNANNFSASFTTKLNVQESQRDYFLQTFADDGVRMYVDDKLSIDSWSKSGQTISKPINLTAGVHNVKTEYSEAGGKAILFSDVLPFDSWVGYLYNNTTKKGAPEDALLYTPTSNSDLSFNYGYNAPGAKNIGSNNFSMKLYTYKKLAAGQYVIHTKSDDAIQIFIDNKKVLEKTSPGEEQIIVDVANSSQGSTHAIRVEYVEKTGKSYLDFSITPVKEELAESSWLAAYYNSTTAAGIGNVYGGNSSTSKISNVFYNWKTAAPNTKTAKDNFSASYYKLLNKGNYFVHTIADDGISATINGQPLFNRWSSSSGKENKEVIPNLQSAGILKINYLEKTGGAFVSADVLPYGQWLGYYYANTSLKGVPANKKIIKGDGNGAFSFDAGTGAPAAGVPVNNYTAQFITAMKLTAGDYVLRYSADDGIRVYVDDKLVLDKWTSSNSSENTVKININDIATTDASKKDVHWIKVQYLEKSGKSKLNFDIKPLQQSVTTSDWLNVFYPNKTLTGTGTVIGGKYAKTKISSIQYKWNKNAPLAGIPADGFSASFLKKITGGQDYFVSTFADDGMRVKVDNKSVINRWSNSGGVYNNGLITSLSSGEHVIQADYYDNTGSAYAYADVQPLGNWIAYYYNNTTLTGAPVASKAVNNSNSMTLTQNFGTAAPAASVNADGFSAKYVTAKRIEAGEYVIRGLSDDGIQVFIDGQPVIDQWNNGSYREKATKVKIADTKDGNIHWIEVRYYDNKGTAKFELSFVPYTAENLVNSTGWYAEYYPKIIGADETPAYTLSDNVKPVVIGGQNSINKITAVNFDWGTGSPASTLGTDKFSAIYRKTVEITEDGLYNFTLQADDGVILEIDGERVINSWESTSSGKREVTGYKLAKGTHEFVLKYYDNTGKASVSFEMKKTKAVYTAYDYLNYSLADAAAIQASKSAQTDKKYKAYVREDVFSYISSYSGYGLINSGSWNVRGGASLNDWIIGKFSTGDKVTILSKTAKDSSGYYWYEVDFYKYYDEIAAATTDMPAQYRLSYNYWVNAGPADIQYYLNPDNFMSDEKQKLQFLKLSASASLNEAEVNAKILVGKGIFAEKASSFIEAGKQYGINEIYLISHALLETGNGFSELATGVTVSSVDGKAVEPMKVYNMYGIGAYDASPTQSGSEYAYKHGWTTPEKAIIGGAEFIGKNYINNATYQQDTLYKMRWNSNNPGVHQYATDIGWASKQVNRMKSLYDLLDSYEMYFEIPIYK